ncbi:MAG: hydrolase [Colwellia sp.]|nr:hydrolase [Colwellia sp.]
MLTKSHFKAAWWLTNTHFQTIAAKWLRRKEKLNTIVETIELPDGDFIDLAWTHLPDTRNNKPIVVILHGLEGSVNSHYVKGMLATIKQRGWVGVLMHFRGCSGRMNRQAAAYHSGDTRDIAYLGTLLKERYQSCAFFLIGFSLGGNVATRYLAQYPENPFTATCIVCAPLHLASCSQRINKGFSKVYQKYLVKMLKDSTRLKIKSQLITGICPEKLNKIKTIWDFDQMITAPLNGFKSAGDYYQQASGLTVLQKIKQHCLIIHAADDPFLNHQSIIFKEPLPKHITFEVTTRGGHVGFISGNNPLKPTYWLEQRIPKFIEQHL